MFSAATGTLSTGGCDRHAKCRREEPPHVRGQGQKPGGPHAQRVAAKRSYPMSEVRGSGREYQTAMAQEQPRGATPHPRSVGRLRGDTQRPSAGPATREVTPRLRAGAAAGRGNPTPEARGSGREDQRHIQGAMAARVQEGIEELSHVEGQEGQR